MSKSILVECIKLIGEKGNTKHILLAENLAIGLKSSVPNGFKAMKKISPGSFQDELDGKAGVIFLKITGSAEKNHLKIGAVTTSIFGIKTESQAPQC